MLLHCRHLLSLTEPLQVQNVPLSPIMGDRTGKGTYLSLFLVTMRGRINLHIGFRSEYHHTKSHCALPVISKSDTNIVGGFHSSMGIATLRVAGTLSMIQSSSSVVDCSGRSYPYCTAV